MSIAARSSSGEVTAASMLDGIAMTRVFLLSPAYCGGRRAAILLNPLSSLPLARDLREGRLALGDAFSFLSGLYFRGKLAYATAFGWADTPHIPATMVITPTRGLLPPGTVATVELLEEF